MASSQPPLYAGFDLGTTNSAAAAFDGDRITVIRNAQGASLTPSVVRIDTRGRIAVGMRAIRYLDRDPKNTRGEFKRLMGTEQKIEFPAASVSKSPEELAAEVLGAMRADMRDQLGVAPDRAVISVPALFELPQTKATSEAARLAGFEQVELLQEPIASALAAGWTEQEAGGTWLVYDLGGGTFDASLLETRDGLLRVVGHDGDNFLGGRDFDLALVDWAIERLAEQGGARLSRENPEHAGALRALKRAAEEAKIELSRATESAISLPEPLVVDDAEVEVDLPIDRATLERVCSGPVERTLRVCRRLLESHGLEPGTLGRVVLVGGPTVTPFLRRQVVAALDAPAADGHDPMTLVAQGAALYAATAGLDARPKKKESGPAGRRLWLQYPAVSSDLTPHVVGRLLDGDGPSPVRVRLAREDGSWQSPEAALDGEGGFILTADLVPRRPNRFLVEAFTDDGSPVAVDPSSITIVQGLTISDPPLSRSIGVALADDSVRVYFERGAPLPARRTFTHHTVESVPAGSSGSVLKIPLVQGEFEQAHLCRLVGTLEIGGGEIRDSLPIDSPVEVTLELDRGGQLSARALVTALDQSFDSVAHLLVPDADVDALESSLADMRRRLSELRTAAFRHGWTRVLRQLSDAEALLAEVEGDIRAARGGDADAGQKALRSLLEADANLVEAELERKWPELEDRARENLAFAGDWVSRYGSDAEKQLLEEVTASVARARESRQIGELQRQLRLVRRLGTAAFYRHPEAWHWMFESAASEVSSATDLPRAQELVREGRVAMERGDQAALRRVVEKLWKLLPTDAKSRRLSFDSGVR